MNTDSPTTSAIPFPIVIVGHVDHGKSTLIGRLLHDTGSLPDGKVEELQAQAERRGADFEWSFVMDALQVERDQGVTVDTTRIWFRTDSRRYVIIDAPGHEEFLRNMVTGAAAADAAVLVIDAAEGVSEQTRRHAYLLEMLGISQIVVAINKMDLVGYDEARFIAVADEVRGYLDGIGITPQAVIPLSARHGVNIIEAREAGAAMPWWGGPSVIDALDGFEPRPAPVDQPLRLPIQDVYRRGDQRFLVGRIVSGRLRVGDQLLFSPGARTARVHSIDGGNDTTPVAAAAGQSVAFTLDEDIFVERGHIAAARDAAPAETNLLRVRLFWLDGRPLAVGDRLTLRLGTASHRVTVAAIDRVIDVHDLAPVDRGQIERNDVAVAVLRSRSRIAHDPFTEIRGTGRAALVRDHRLVGGCIIEGAADSGAARNLTAVSQTVTVPERAAANGHHGGVLWLTGLSGSGKSTLAMALQRQLFERGHQVYVLDGDNLRQGLTRDLGFGPAERAENIRRVAEVAALFADAGFLVVTAFISPYREDRDNARAIAGDGFREVFVKCSLEVCEQRDPKGLYSRARAGEIPEFTGVSAPYEEPVAPELVVDTEALGLDEALALLVEDVDRHFSGAGDVRRVANG